MVERRLLDVGERYGSSDEGERIGVAGVTRRVESLQRAATSPAQNATGPAVDPVRR